MKNKIKFILPVLALGFVFSGGVAFADNTTPAPTVISKKVCMVNAKTARVTAVKTALTNAKNAKVAAKTTLVNAITAAKANSDKTAAKAAKKAAQLTYKSTISTIVSTHAESVKNAWAQFANAITNCRG